MMFRERTLSLAGQFTPRGTPRGHASPAARRQAARRYAVMEAVESRIMLSTLSVLGNGVAIVSGSTTIATANDTDFGPTDVNYLTRTETYTLTDPDPSTALNLTGNAPVSISGADAADFTVSAQPASDTIAANGGSTTFTITFKAQDLGDRNALITVASDDTASNGNFTFYVGGEAMPAIDLGNATPSAGIAIQPGSATTPNNFTDFTYTDVNDGNFTLTRSFLLEDTGAAAVNLTGSPLVSIGGASAADFTVTAQPTITTVDGTHQTAFTVTFAPLGNDTGLRTATVSISNSGNTSPFTFNIQGTALAALSAATGYDTLYTTLSAGTAGTASATGDNIVVNYTGYLLDGTKFDSSLNSGRVPFNFVLGPDSNNNDQNDVITGWEEGMLNLNVGEQRVLLIPADEAYGITGSPGSIPPNANLIFVVQRLQQIGMFSDPGGDNSESTYIDSGSTTTTTTNDTDLGVVGDGASVTNMFDITAPYSPPTIAPGNSTANWQVTLSGANAAQFSTSGFQTATDDNGNNYAYFTVTFAPGNGTLGAQQATVNFDYTMTTQANVTTPFDYTFTVQGTALLAPVFSNLTVSPTIPAGTAAAAFGGTIAAGASIPPSTETVAITLNGVTQNAAIGANGNFTSTFDTSALPVSTTPYQVTYAYAGDANFASVTDDITTTLTITPGTASIAGTIYADTNHTGVWNAADPKLADVMVYLDTNNNGQLDYNEISVNTNASGNYLFSNLPAGNYTVREVPPGNYTQTSPAVGYINVSLSTGQAVTGQTFLDAPAGTATAVAVYRLYSPVTLEHLYTTDPNEYNTLEQYVGTWNPEGEVFSEYSAPATLNGVADEPLYRLYDSGDKQHFWTDNYNEYNTLRIAPWNWNDEGIVGYVFPSAVASSEPLYRMMAPQVHLWTTDVNEYDTLVSEGWTQEGVIGYVL